MTDSNSYEPPEHLINAILQGRCIAFVGAGFSASAVPSWPELLKKIALKLGIDMPAASVGANAFEFEAIGQHLCDRAGAGWETLVQSVLVEAGENAMPDKRRILAQRARLLTGIPFKAILTTNFDASLNGKSPDAATYREVLRHERGWWSNAPDESSRRQTPVLKLHGDANGSGEASPLVLGRAEYRRLLYDDSRYANFLRAAFAEYTVLFFGVSFTDAYLNELRSEVLKLIGGDKVEGDQQWGYAVMNRPSDYMVKFFGKHEHIDVLADPTEDFSGFDKWLETIHERTSIAGRLTTLLQDKRVIWVDNSPAHNDEGYRLLGGAERILELTNPDDLDETLHHDAAVIITRFGYADGWAFEVMKRVNTWKTRPPVIVFAAPGPENEVAKNRLECLRRGAWEFTTEWSELYRSIEVLLGRLPGSMR